MALSIKVGITSNPFILCLLATQSKQCQKQRGLFTSVGGSVLLLSVLFVSSTLCMFLFFLLFCRHICLIPFLSLQPMSIRTSYRKMIKVASVFFPLSQSIKITFVRRSIPCFILIISLHEFKPYFERSTENIVFCHQFFTCYGGMRFLFGLERGIHYKC